MVRATGRFRNASPASGPYPFWGFPFAPCRMRVWTCGCGGLAAVTASSVTGGGRPRLNRVGQEHPRPANVSEDDEMHELLLNPGDRSADGHGVDLNDLAAASRRARRERPPPEGRPAADRSAATAHLSALEGWAPLESTQLEQIVERDRRLRSDAARGLPRDRRARHRLPGARPAALPRQRVPPARRDLVRVPRDPERGARASTSCGFRPASGGSPTSTTASSS